VVRRVAAQECGERHHVLRLAQPSAHDEVLVYQRPVPEAVLAAIRRGQARGVFDPAADPSAPAEVLTAVYFDTLTRWLTQAGAPCDLPSVLAGKLDLVLTGLAPFKVAAMNEATTSIRLIETGDAQALAAHLTRDAEAFARYTQMDNLASQHVLRRNGFVPCGVARSRIFTAGQWRDEVLWECLLDQNKDS